MKKRAQITVFLIAALVILILAGLYFYLGKNVKKDAAREQEAKETDIVKSYVESCIKAVAEQPGLFERIGEQGGYIDVNANPDYGEEGAVSSQISPQYVSFQAKNVPYYLEAYCEEVYCSEYASCAVAPCACTKQKCRRWNSREYVPNLDAIRKKLANYIAVEFEKCFDKNVFESQGIKIEKPVVDYKAINFDFSQSDVSVEVKANEEDVAVKLDYPLTITKGETKSKLDSFIVVLPVRLNAAFEGSRQLVDDMKESIESRLDTDYISNVPFTILPSDCPGYAKKPMINLYTKGSKIIELADLSNYFTGRPNAYFFRFAVKNIAVSGGCT